MYLADGGSDKGTFSLHILSLQGDILKFMSRTVGQHYGDRKIGQMPAGEARVPEHRRP
jgi:hypothetical protein